VANDGIVRTLSEADWARLTRRKKCGNEHATPILRQGENDETRRLESTLHQETLRLPHAVQLPSVIGLPPVDDDINCRSGEPLFDPSPRPSSEEENSLWSNAVANDGIVSTFSEADWARLTRRKNCGNEHATPVLRQGENDETRRLESTLHQETLRLRHAVQLPAAIGLPPVDDDINRRSGGEPLFDPSPRPSSEEENSLWSTPHQLAMRARPNPYAIGDDECPRRLEPGRYWFTADAETDRELKAVRLSKWRNRLLLGQLERIDTLCHQPCGDSGPTTQIAPSFVTAWAFATLVRAEARGGWLTENACRWFREFLYEHLCRRGQTKHAPTIARQRRGPPR
jgi:hypothetical protein